MARQSAKYMEYSWELLQRQLLLKRIPLSAFEQVTQLCRAFFYSKTMGLMSKGKLCHQCLVLLHCPSVVLNRFS